MSGDVSHGSAFSFPGRTAQAIAKIITGTSPVSIAGSTLGPMQVVWFQVTEVAGGTANLTIDLFDGTTAYILHPLAAMTAKQELFYGRGFWIPVNWSLRITTSVSLNAHVIGLATIPAQQN